MSLLSRRGAHKMNEYRIHAKSGRKSVTASTEAITTPEYTRVWFAVLQVEGFNSIDPTSKPPLPSPFPSSIQLAFGEEYDYKKNYFRPLDVLTNTFCSTGQLDANGVFYSLGGTTNDPNYQIVNGAASVRKFVPCDGGPGATCGFSIAGGMSSRRWYPTSQILPDGRIFIIGGGNLVGNLAINNGDANNPTYEFWPGGGERGIPGNGEGMVLPTSARLVYLFPMDFISLQEVI